MLLDVGVEARAVEFDANVSPRLVTGAVIMDGSLVVMGALLMGMRGIVLAAAA